MKTKTLTWKVYFTPPVNLKVIISNEYIENMVMKYPEEIMKIWRGEGSRVVWQPRIEYWYNVNKNKDKLPPDYKDKDLLEIYDDLEASVRYIFPDGNGFLEFEHEDVKISTKTEQKKEGEKRKTSFKTPLGKLEQIEKTAMLGEGAQIVKPLVENQKDMEIMEYILKQREVKFNKDYFEKAQSKLENRGIVQFFFPRSPLPRLVIQYMGLERTYRFFNHDRERMEKFMQTIDQSLDEVFNVLEDCPVKVFNFGENIDVNLFPPSFFERYCVPYYERRIEQLHKAKKYCHLHVDGSFEPLIPYLKNSSFDGLEALTPKPQGDVTLDQIKKVVDNEKVLLDGIPAILFLDEYSREKLKNFVGRLMNEFSPRLILGVSDELPPNAEIGRVKMVSKLVKEFNP